MITILLEQIDIQIEGVRPMGAEPNGDEKAPTLYNVRLVDHQSGIRVGLTLTEMEAHSLGQVLQGKQAVQVASQMPTLPPR